MSDDDNRLEKEREEVERRFANHPSITIVSTEGTPVNKYVVEYRVKGLVRLDDGEIAKSDQHRVEISLSFGFPHFPPNCKPLTQIFHPDIDPSAIKIADFWSADESMVSLIIHIGQMICWQVYSEENVFNQEAEAWLGENSDAVPLDTVDLSGGTAGETSAPTPEPAIDEAKEIDVDLGISSEDLPELAFDTVELGGEEPVAAPETEADEPAELDIDFGVPENGAGGQKPAEDVADVAKDLDFSFQAPTLEQPEKTAATDIVVEEVDIAAEHPVDEVEGEVDLDFATVDVDYDILCGMIDQRNYFAAQRKLDTMAPENLSEAAAGLRPEIETHIRDAEKIFQEALELEKQELLEEAARKFEAVLNIARDYPQLEENMKRVRNAWMASMGAEEDGEEAAEPPDSGELDLSGLGGGEIEVPEEMAPLTLESADEEEPEVELPSPPAGGQFAQPEKGGLSGDQPPSPPPVGMGTPPGTARQPAKKPAVTPKKPVQPVGSKKPLVIGLVVVFLVLALSGWAFVEWSSLQKAKEKWSTVHNLLEQGNYEEVNQRCMEITSLLDRVHFVMTAEKKELLAQVEDIVSSEHFQEAIGGKVYYKDKYISKLAHAAYLEIEKLVAEGEKKGSVSDWQGALANYESALAVAEKNKKRLDEKFYNEVVFKVKRAQFANHVAQGKRAFVSKQWPVAITHFDQALELAKTKGVADPTSIHDVTRYLQRARFSQYIIDGDSFLKKGDWKEAVAQYQGAYDIARKSEVIDKENRESVTLKLHQTTLMKGITEGDKYSKLSKWGQALDEYQKAESVLAYDVTIPGKSVAETRQRVARSLLAARFHQERSAAQSFLAAKQYGKAASALQRAIQAIDASPLKKKADWQLLRQEAQEELKRASLQDVIEEKTAYLYDHYQEIFVENFDGVRAKALDQPQVKFLEATGNALVFRLRCRELRDLKYYTLELIYQYDMAKDSWGFQGG